MAVEADKVVVELEAKTGAFSATVKRTASDFQQATSVIEQSAVRAEKAIAHSANSSRVSQQILQHVTRSASDQFAAGTPILQIFTTHLAQVAEAGAYAGGSLGKFGAFLGGPWGLAVTAAVTIAATIAPTLIKAGESTDDLVEKMRKQAEQAARNKAADDAWKQTIDGLTESIRKRREEQEKSLQTDQQAEQSSLNAASAELQSALEKRAATLTEIVRLTALQKQQQAAAQVEGPKGQITPAQQAYADTTRQLKKAREDFATLEKDIADAESAVRGASIPLAERNVLDRTDAVTAATDAYTAALGRLRKERESGKITAGQFEKQLEAETRKRDAAIKAAQEAARSHPDADATQFVSPAHGAISGQFGTQRPGHTHAGVDIAVPVGTSVAAAAGGTIIEAGTLPGYGNVVIIDHGRGTVTRYAHLSNIGVTKGQTVSQGQIIGLSGGARGAEGAGNSQGLFFFFVVWCFGRAVDPRTAAFPTDATTTAKTTETTKESDNKAVKRLAEVDKKAAVELAHDFKSVEDRLDPTAAAAHQFNEELRIIEAWKATGAITATRALELQMLALKRAAEPTLEAIKKLYAGQIRQKEGVLGSKVTDADKEMDAQRRIAEGHIRDLADLYESLFTGGTANLWDEFKRQGLRALAVLAAQQTFKFLTGQDMHIGQGGGGADFFSQLFTIGSSLFGGGGGASTAASSGSNFLDGISAAFGRSGGGYVAPRSVTRVNEHKSGIELLRMGSQGGTVLSLGDPGPMAQSNTGTTIIHAPQFNLRGAVVTPELYREMERISNDSARAHAAAMGRAVLKATPGRMSQFGVDGT